MAFRFAAMYGILPYKTNGHKASVTHPIAQLPMYDFPEIRGATDAFWRAVAERLRRAGLSDVPGGLSRHFDRHEAWRHRGLLIGQSCGYPAMTEYREALAIIAVPLYTAAGCEGTRHRSFIIVPAGSPARSVEHLRGGRFALNARDSNSGMNLARHAFAPLAARGRFFGAVIETGSHAASLALVAREGADTAAIDCVTHAHLARHRAALVGRTRILAETASGPSLPFVTARGTDRGIVAMLREALAGAAADIASAPGLDALFLAGVAPADESDYAVLLDYEREAQRLGYAELA
jgi:ABC-type phosphate/phosphonate transport system substrate-binding protein